MKLQKTLSKYKDREREIKRTRVMKTAKIHPNKIPSDIKLQEDQKIILSSTTHILRKTLSIKWIHRNLTVAQSSKDGLGAIIEQMEKIVERS